jgi:hypothetical protein
MWQSLQYRCGKRVWPRIYRTASRYAWLFLLILLFAHKGVLRADITVKGGEVIAKPGTASVVLGDSVKISLVAIRPGGLQKLKFRIIAQPINGTLSEIQPDPADTSRAWVVYTPRQGTAEESDSFSFNAKLEGQNASPSALVSLRLEAPVAQLVVNPVLPFGKVEVGHSRTLGLEITNRGTKSFSSVLRLPAPWSIAEDQQRLEVRAGGSATIDVTFSPKDLRPAKYLLMLQVAGPEGKVELSGAGAPPFGVQYGTFDLDWDEASKKRTGSFRLANLTDRKLALKLTASEPLEVERLVVLEPRKASNVPVSLGGIEEFEGQLLVESEHHRDSVPVHAKPTPANIVVLKPAEARHFKFELMDTDSPPVYEVVVTNSGGGKAFIYGETSRPFYVVEGGDPTELASGKQMKITVSMDPREVGKYERPLYILGTANKIEFQLSALVTRDVDRTKVGVNLPDLAPLISSQETLLYNNLPDPMTRVFNHTDKTRIERETIPPVQKLYIKEQGSRKLVFTWDHPGSPDLNYLLEVEVYERNEDGLPKIVWYEASDHVTIDKDDKTATMTLKKLQPDRQFRMRVLTMDRNGHTSVPSRSYLVYTLPPGRKPLWLLVPFFLVVGGGFYVWLRRRAG